MEKVSRHMLEKDVIFAVVEWNVLYMFVAATAATSLHSCPTLCDPIDGSPPGSSIHGIFQSGALEWGYSSLDIYLLYLYDMQAIYCSHV